MYCSVLAQFMLYQSNLSNHLDFALPDFKWVTHDKYNFVHKPWFLTIVVY
jgi:hypothetical protein